MLQLQSKITDFVRISKVLVKYNVKAHITGQAITLDGDLSNELLTELLDIINIKNIKNFSDEQNSQPETSLASESNIIYPEVKRGQVYFCNLGEPYGAEQGYTRPVVVVQNDNVNCHAATTIVLPCTTNPKPVSTNLYLTLSKDTLCELGDLSKLSLEECAIKACQIRTIDKSRLLYYVGTLTPEIMQKVQEKIDLSIKETHSKSKELNNFNFTQMKLLSFVDIKELLNISQSNLSDEKKTKNFLESFGFDFKRNGMEYLPKAIISSQNTSFNLETICENISRGENIDKEEIKRVVVARVKENFNFKFSTIEFIRLINFLLTGGNQV